MPKVKKIRAPALQSSNPTSYQKNRNGSHEQPLGQVIQDDTNRNLYATIKRKSTTTSGVVSAAPAAGRSNSNNQDKKQLRRYGDDIDDDEYYKDSNNANDTTAVELDEKSSQRIVALSLEQQREIRQSELLLSTAASASKQLRFQQLPRRDATTKQSRNSNRNDDSDDEDDDDDDQNGKDNEIDSNDDYEYNIDVDRVGDDGEYVDMVDMKGISAEDEAIIASMMKGRQQQSSDSGTTGQQQRTLADIILEKIAQKEQEQQRQNAGEDMNSQQEDQYHLPPKVIEVYTDIGRILSRYTSGKLPKAFKVIPSLSNWEEVLYITRPDTWTPAAMFAATRIFASNCNVKMATKFYNLVLLDSVRNDIYTHKKLNYHYYMSLKKSIYKPQSFFKGILLPLCQENCTLREAAIVASVLQRVSIPVHHAAVAIHKLATMHQSNNSSLQLSAEYSGATSIFIKTLLNKKYSLPAPVISSVLQYFTSFLYHSSNNTIVLPVLWHQALLVFVQRYKNAIVIDDDNIRDIFRKLLKQHYHHKITPEIRRELFGNVQAYQEEQQIKGQQQHGPLSALKSKHQPMEM